MKEILFRGKRIDNGEWVYGDIIHRHYYKNTDVVVIRTEDSGFDNYSDYEVDPDTVGQFTGLTDKNGKKIFEKDILSAHLDDGYPENETLLEVVWHNNGWYGKNGKFFDDFDNGFEKYFEVIGNVHDGGAYD